MMQNDAAADVRFTAATSAILEGGRLALSYFHDLSDLQVETKANGQDVVSIADRAVELLIKRRIATDFPEDGFVGEETGFTEGRSGFTWVLDPIDGTSCFVHGIRSWCVSLALLEGRETVAGLIFDPCADELFTAVIGKGAFLNGASIRVDTSKTIQNGLIGLGANLRVPPRVISKFVHVLLEHGGIFVRSGSGALSLSQVACGRLAAYYEPHIHSWDCLAGLCLIREAGGWTEEFAADGDLVSGGKVIATSPQLRNALLTIIAMAAQGNDQ